MPRVQRQGDANSAGGVITSGDSSVMVNGRPIAVENLSVTPHPPCPKPKLIVMHKLKQVRVVSLLMEKE